MFIRIIKREHGSHPSCGNSASTMPPTMGFHIIIYFFFVFHHRHFVKIDLEFQFQAFRGNFNLPGV